jgi:CBS domain-containing protein
MPYVSSVMTGVPVTLREDDKLIAAARAMRDNAVGVVMVVRDGRLRGLVTDRDIVVRALAAGRDPADIPVRDVCSGDPVTVGPDDEVGAAVRLMRERAVRRLPVVEDGHPVGMVSIGDLAAEQDGQSALAEISIAPPTF